jgi:hypothetical protein
MVPQRKSDDDELEKFLGQEPRTPPTNPFVGKLASADIDVPAEVTSPASPSKTYYPKYPVNPPHPPRPTDDEYPGYWGFPASPTALVTSTRTSLLSGGLETPSVTTSSVPDESLETSPASNTSNSKNDHGWQHPGWHDAKEKVNGGMYAGATITSFVVLAAIGGFVYFYMRKRKRQQAATIAAQLKIQELKMHPSSTAQSYMAPPPAVSLQYGASHHHRSSLANPVTPHPIILGPIPSGSNGAYFTGIDTSDVISMTSATHLRPPNQFADNDSLTEPPPPYRPRSTAPPSLTNTSRHSSFRVTAVPPTTSQTHLIERSPFEDSFDDDDHDDDAISDLSGPTAGHGEDAMSAVSDLSYQQDPVVNRSSL